MNFESAAKETQFIQALGELEVLCGSPPVPHASTDGRFTFQVQSDRKLDLEKVHSDFLTRGAYVFTTESRFKNSVTVLPTTDKYDVMQAMHTNGANHDLGPDDVVAWMRKLEEDQPFVLFGIGHDFLSGRFTTKIENPAELAERMYKFCPDIVDQGVGEVEELAAELERSNRLFFWWD